MGRALVLGLEPEVVQGLDSDLGEEWVPGPVQGLEQYQALVSVLVEGLVRAVEMVNPRYFL